MAVFSQRVIRFLLKFKTLDTPLGSNAPTGPVSIRRSKRTFMPTYEERQTWAPGDGHGLRVHQLGAFDEDEVLLSKSLEPTH